MAEVRWLLFAFTGDGASASRRIYAQVQQKAQSVWGHIMRIHMPGDCDDEVFLRVVEGLAWHNGLGNFERVLGHEKLRATLNVSNGAPSALSRSCM